MDIKPQLQQSISDDQELAKVLAGVSGEADEAAAQQTVIPPLPPMPAAPAADDPTASVEPPVPPATDPTTPLTMPTSSDNLDSVKQEAITELRPLVDKLTLAPEEKFDTYLLLIRSTDDKTLIAPAHEAAKAIVDEARRAQALLDIIKEIDFLSHPQ
ncbi:hypothetical protein L336_0561 [Candidatus Saccharimonas aalborgensis]|uniref:Uncharacterized protein n=1 Tax=Candidatus Saccharimonas aalborgensis TaxID=1332188 RepID=R4PMY2_9BACT|nr:hypothetical protein [Candidatus Saccharimonas aalborgensis]AGL62264.1 hypothetical protein L336_0561 [Candidatus Saccharimonas aalborgensis]QQS68772.1 MAG: hypothetical protein IPP24_01955 [Candidatus Saccharibacteria bacterium]QQS71057.1 MAG: hypothetical protein IPP92_02090 [Candidatus Saccharibacteria bacterium]